MRNVSDKCSRGNRRTQFAKRIRLAAGSRTLLGKLIIASHLDNIHAVFPPTALRLSLY
jgi:hypothetical protein